MIETPETNEENPHRGQTASQAPESPSESQMAENIDDDLDFVVTEAHNQPTDLVGGFDKTKDDDLGIETPADLMEAEASHDVGAPHQPDPQALSPIGDTTPPPPPPADKPFDQDPGPTLANDPETAYAPISASGLEKLSDERLQEISQQMQGTAPNDAYLSSEEKRRLLSSIDEAPIDKVEATPSQSEPKIGFDNEPIVLPSKQKSGPPPSTAAARPSPTPTETAQESIHERPKISARVRGVAHFARDYIKITGGQELHEGDCLVINDREYLLRHKKFDSKMIIGIVGAFAAILIFALGTMLSSNADTGAGQVVGLVLGDDDRPYISGTEIRFPELGTTVESNGQGFFKTDALDAGTYKIELLYEGEVLATDYTTVVSDQITTITMRPQPPTEPPPEVRPAKPIAQIAPAPPQPTAKATPPPTQPKAAPKKSASSGSRWSKLALEANVDGAKLTVDGSVLGAGNLTYSRLKPGLHQYVVSKDGYQSYRGSVDLKAGRTKTLNVSLTPQPKVEKPAAPPEQQPFNQATDYLNRGEIAAAITNFNQAIQLNPSYAEAYFGRGRAYEKDGASEPAFGDYLSAAEISSANNDFNPAISAYAKALALKPKSIPVLLGRGNLYLSRGEEIAAIADFDMVIRLDKRNLQGYLGLGQARYDQGYFKKAIKHFKDARSLASDNPLIHRNLMMCYYRTGDFKQVKKSHEKFVRYASEAEQRAMRSDPGFAPVLKVIGD